MDAQPVVEVDRPLRIRYTDVHVERGSRIDDSVLLPKVEIGRNVTLKRVIVDKFCQLPDGFTAGIEHASDSRKFQVTPQGIVLITPEMLGQHIHEWS